MSVLMIGLAVGGAVWGAWPSVPWTSLSPTGLPEVLAAYTTDVARVADVANVGSLILSGHRAGSYQSYAIDLDPAAPRPKHPKPIIDLVARSFGALGLNAVEIDVRASPFDPQALVVVHDRIPNEPSVRAYAEQNSLRGLLRAWIARGWAASGKHVFLELKAPGGGLDEEATQSADRIAGALNDVLGAGPDPRRLRSLVHLISFSVPALVRARAGLGAAAKQHAFLQVVTSNRYPAWVFSLDGRFPPFDEAAQERLRTTPWLTGLFFDPRFVKGFATIFNRINDARVESGFAPLAIHVSTYSHTQASLVARLEAEPERLRHVEGMIFQIRDDEPERQP